MKIRSLTGTAAVALGAIAVLLLAPLKAHAGIACTSGSDCLAIGYAEPSAGISATTVNDHVTGTGGLDDQTFAAGTFTSVTVDVTGSPAVAQPDLLSSNVSVSGGETATETLILYVTEQNITGPLGVNSLLSSFSTTLLLSPAASVTEDTFVDPGNSLYANALTSTAVLLATTTCTVNNCSTNQTDATPNLTGQYSETLEYLITVNGTSTNGRGQFDGGISLTAAPVSVPEPASLAIFGASLIGLVGFNFLRSRKKKGVSKLDG